MDYDDDICFSICSDLERRKMKVIRKCEYVPSSGEVNNGEPLECLDTLKPLSVAQMLERFCIAGEKLEATRRRELEGIQADVDDPDDIRTDLDDVEDLHDVDVALKNYRSKKSATSKKTTPEVVEKASPEVLPPESGKVGSKDVEKP